MSSPPPPPKESESEISDKLNGGQLGIQAVGARPSIVELGPAEWKKFSQNED